MNKFLSFLVSRSFIAFVALLAVALVIWFVGPFVAFGGLTPLAGAGCVFFTSPTPPDAHEEGGGGGGG